MKRKDPSPALQDPVKPAKRNTPISPSPADYSARKLTHSTAASWPQQNMTTLEKNMQTLVNMQRNGIYQPSNVVNNNMTGSTPTSLQSQFYPIHKPDFPPYAKNIPMASWMTINHNAQPGYFTPAMI